MIPSTLGKRSDEQMVCPTMPNKTVKAGLGGPKNHVNPPRRGLCWPGWFLALLMSGGIAASIAKRFYFLA